MTDVPAPIWIADSASLAAAMAECGEVVGVDTEFLRTDTFYPIAGLFQICSGDTVWLLDPLAIDDFSSFTDVLEDPAITKVMHACLEDLELLWHRLRTRPVNLFDTQLAYAYLSTRFSIGFVGLVDAVLGIELEQSHTRSDWMRRPLSAGQLHYAAEDVWYLLPIYDLLRERLASSGRIEWFAEDMAEHGVYAPEAPEDYYRDVNRAWTLDARALGRLRDLCTWREQAARRLDMPRKRLVWDEHLVELARRAVILEDDIAELLPPAAARRFGRELLHVHASSTQSLEPLSAPLTPSEGKRIRRLREVAVNAAERLELAPELVARKRDLEALFRHYRIWGELSPQYNGWRRGIVGTRLLEELVGAT